MSLPKEVWEKGYVQVYTGDGKGKTTAGFGLALRAAGAGFKVFIGQFAKGMNYVELQSFARFSDLITLKQLGSDQFIWNDPSPQDLERAALGLKEAKEAVSSGLYKLVILDEANVAVGLKLFSIEALLEVVEAKRPEVELLITGRGAHPLLVERADLVTEMKMIKHYFDQGVIARMGIEC
ncbi:MAG: cob(I)yrinic acid a,c-diamide adenosyltransferase [Candidatus Lambdaproteobacteria bacterium RIFOXYD1_FULL_56_27]|uniref:Corrinoid adenosyltransferase n=1 Tax=Candidatus Lambdaproteobacteria bacterium RIFOXYD2_FULL_56_26 TaxID=1817773 RepID=A0A1F6H3Q2_9PROT|nr:MAG: cob(I)yrinic acid a,c-diamide adenosyltransferase [Candidatus Lambdaproteobacteria bacterium RIFOXYC1_FULL_56_13]OGH04993.1 MAG: cob(I)yrinic acid a,c-diamide adenosyltransferase [Candidatus Lambdaproteobacteria bacterium RIFOXYD2_FULL_56_26]OGH09458.1 MAG: cob(I)yrinic acid a,c-diamide adenosyltransferase [Candidatus Lambdaproteobacteria bacterium RIFOXYD1_FULL_56_27]